MEEEAADSDMAEGTLEAVVEEIVVVLSGAKEEEVETIKSLMV